MTDVTKCGSDEPAELLGPAASIKTLWSARPQYGVSVRSWDIYTAVLDYNVRDTDEFARWLTRKQP